MDKGSSDRKRQCISIICNPLSYCYRARGLPTPKYNDNELFQAMEGEAVR